jgi:uncharacterized PurR-regulated membrane protein YhhQ (DUF165 family)
MAPSGVLLIGAALALRDALQERLGRGAVWTLVAAGSALAFLSSPSLAVASATAFLLSETLDFAVYDRLRASSRTWAIILSGLAGAVLDSVLFSLLAFGTIEWSAGLILAKLYASLLYACWIRRPAWVRWA